MFRKFLSKPTWHLLLVVALGVIGYSNTLNAPFQFDDVQNIIENPIIKNLDHYISTEKAKIYNGSAEYPLLINRYIGSLSFALNYKIHKLNVTGYHVANILIHLINSLMVYWFVRLVFISLAAGSGGDSAMSLKYASTFALFSALLFVAHPVQTQAVTYITQRFSSLATMFYLISITMYVKARLKLDDVDNKGLRVKISPIALVFYLLSLFFAVLAMKTKEIAFTLPVMIVMCDLLFFTGNVKRRILYLAPFVLTMLIIPATLLGVVGAGGGAGAATRLATDMSRLDYLFTEFRVIITYIRLILIPIGQNLDYDYPVYHAFFDHEVLLSFLAILIICCAVLYSFWRYRKDYPLTRVVLFGAAWFFVTLSVESSVIPIVDVIFEHRIYLPSFGIFLVISVLSVMIIDKFRQKGVDSAVVISFIMIAMVLTGFTYSRNKVWNDRISLWQDVVNKSPGKARGHNYLGIAHNEKGDLDLAIKHYRQAVALNYSDPNTYSNLGKACFEKGLIDEAIEAFKNAIKIDQLHANAHINLGIAYGQKGLIQEAKSEMMRGEMLKNR